MDNNTVKVKIESSPAGGGPHEYLLNQAQMTALAASKVFVIKDKGYRIDCITFNVSGPEYFVELILV